MSLFKRRNPEPIDPGDLANRKMRFAIAYMVKVRGRNKTALYLRAWSDQLKNDHSAESIALDAINTEGEK